MAEDEGKFSHIVVTDDEDDEEVVIYTGRRAAESLAAPTTSEPDEDDSDEPDEEEGLAEDIDGAKRPAQPEPAPEEQPKKKKKEKYVYRETTAEDLEDTSMSVVQKAILVFCVVFLIGFCIYYYFNYM